MCSFLRWQYMFPSFQVIFLQEVLNRCIQSVGVLYNLHQSQNQNWLISDTSKWLFFTRTCDIVTEETSPLALTRDVYQQYYTWHPQWRTLYVFHYFGLIGVSDMNNMKFYLRGIMQKGILIQMQTAKALGSLHIMLTCLCNNTLFHGCENG